MNYLFIYNNVLSLNSKIFTINPPKVNKLKKNLLSKKSFRIKIIKNYDDYIQQLAPMEINIDSEKK